MSFTRESVDVLLANHSITTTELGVLLGMATNSARRWAKRNNLRTVMIGHTMHVLTADVLLALGMNVNGELREPHNPDQLVLRLVEEA